LFCASSKAAQYKKLNRTENLLWLLQGVRLPPLLQDGQEFTWKHWGCKEEGDIVCRT